MNRPSRILGLLAAGLLAVLLLPLAPLLPGPSAAAVQAVSHGQGVLWAHDHTSWLGDYLLDDGAHGFCIDVEKPPPTGTDVDYVSGRDAGLFGADDSARLSYLSRRWGQAGDPLTAAAAQLATWTITGLAGRDQAFFAQRANADAGLVLTAANHMLDLANGSGGASRGARATAELALSGGAGTVSSNVIVDFLAGEITLNPYSVLSTMTLHGAVFGDGRSSMTLYNGVTVPIVPDQAGATENVTLDVSYRSLPFGADYRLGRNTGGAQSLIVSPPNPIDVAASASASGPSGIPFRPRVQTKTSAAVASAGAELSDLLTLGAHPQSPLGADWGVYRAPDGSLAPIPVVISSVLWGPFGQRPAESATVPAGAPRACEVEVTAAAGPGEYNTPSCTIAEPGFYVWTDSIDPARTPPERGGDRLRGWKSGFGVAAETTLLPAPAPSVSTVASVAEVIGSGCVSDRLSITGLPVGGKPIPVHVSLIGPLAARPAAESVPPGWEQFPVAGTTSLRATADGTYTTECIPVAKPGFYYFVHASLGSAGVPVPTLSLTRPPSPDAAPTPPAAEPPIPEPTTGVMAPTPGARDTEASTAVVISRRGAPEAAASEPAAAEGADPAEGEEAKPLRAEGPQPLEAEGAEPLQTGPLEAAPIEAGPLQAEPVEPGPVEPGPVEAEPLEAGPPAELVPAFSDYRVHETESVTVVAPPAPPAPPTPGAPAAPPVVPPAPPAPPAPPRSPSVAQLARTGSGGPSAASTALAVLAAAAGLAIVGLSFGHTPRRRRRPR